MPREVAVELGEEGVAAVAEQLQTGPGDASGDDLRVGSGDGDVQTTVGDQRRLVELRQLRVGAAAAAVPKRALGARLRGDALGRGEERVLVDSRPRADPLDVVEARRLRTAGEQDRDQLSGVVAGSLRTAFTCGESWIACGLPGSDPARTRRRTRPGWRSASISPM